MADKVAGFTVVVVVFLSLLLAMLIIMGRRGVEHFRWFSQNSQSRNFSNGTSNHRNGNVIPKGKLSSATNGSNRQKSYNQKEKYCTDYVLK